MAASRELFEETGIVAKNIGSSPCVRIFHMEMHDGRLVQAEERFFLVRVESGLIDSDRWTSPERELISDYKWWTVAELAATTDTVFPDDLAHMPAAIEPAAVAAH
jgi:8-oxo-dGTP pyrophosphatase MutT (NUDIX family)